MLTAQIRAFKAKLAQGPVFGIFSKASDPAFVEAAGHAGLDFIIIDLEHAPNSVETAQNLIRGAQIAGILPIVRVKEDRLSVIGEVLDVGAAGVQAPQIVDAASAAAVVERAKFAPAGARGVCRFVRAADYSSLERDRYFRESNEALVIAQLEGTAALRNVESILAVPGIDVIFIGPYDLSQSLGVTGQVGHPLLLEKMAYLVELCSRKGMAVGTFVDTLESAEKWIAAGVRYVSYSVDVGIFTDACRHLTGSLAQIAGRGSNPKRSLPSARSG
jgi:4-hydroxy-2-oxoheptanedioate aldolase